MTRHPRSGLKRFFRLVTLLGMAVTLASAAGAAYLWLLHARASVEGYQPPLPVQPRPSGRPTRILAPQVLVVVIGGLRNDVVAEMPTLALLQREGASAQLTSRPPAPRAAAWATLVTGAWPELSGAPIYDLAGGEMRPLAVDHLFAATRRANLTTAIAGADPWPSLVPEEFFDAHYHAASEGPAADRQIADTALRFLTSFRPHLLLVGLGNLDGPALPARQYGQPAQELDEHLRTILEALDLQRSVLMVVSDLGDVSTPFAAIGGPIIPGRYGPLAQTDLAPTIAAILGAPVPRLAQGSIRFEMLRGDESKRAEAEAELALQRQAYAELYLRAIGQPPLSETSHGDVAVALSSLQIGNLESAYQLATIAVDRIDREVAAARQQRIGQERNLRLPAAAAVVAAPLVFLLLRRRRRDLWLLLAAVATLLAYQGLVRWEGGVCSPSVLPEPNVLVAAAARRMGYASLVGAALVLWRLARDGEGSALGIIETSLGYSLAVVYLLACQAAVAYWWNGPRLTWYVPDPRLTWLQFAALAQVPPTAAIGFVLPTFLLLAGVAYQGALAARRRLRPSAGGR